MKMKNHADVVIEALHCFESGFEKLRSGPAEYYFEVLRDQVNLLFERYAPFHIGDRVKLTEPPEIDESSGWWHCRHFLIKGACGEVRNVEADANGFFFEVMLDNETWIDSKGKVNPVTEKHVFCFREDILTSEDSKSVISLPWSSAKWRDLEAKLKKSEAKCARLKSHLDRILTQAANWAVKEGLYPDNTDK